MSFEGKLLNKKAVIYHHGITGSGGSERITLEEEKYFKAMGINTTILSFDYDSSVFNNTYSPNIKLIHPQKFSRFFWIKILQKILTLRAAIQKLQPDYILGVGEEGCIYLYFGTLFTHYKYSAHVPQTIFWDLQTYGDMWDISPLLLGRYSRIFEPVYKEIRNFTAGHKESLPKFIPKMSIKKKIFSEIIGLVTYIAVRKSRHIFVLSKIMAWEVNKMYKRGTIILKGAYPESIFGYMPLQNIKEKLGVQDKKIVLSLCRLEEKKRVDLTIKAFAVLVEKREDIALIIGGSGTVEVELKNLAQNLGLNGKVFFPGFIHETEMYDYYYYCDVFVSADHSDYDITTYMALGFGKKVVWTIENETEENLISERLVFPADITSEGFANALNLALDSECNNSIAAGKYSFETYFANILKILGSKDKSN